MSIHFTIVLVGLAVICIGPSFGQVSDDLKRKFDQAYQKIIRLPPSAFPELPGNIVRELQRCGCTIPQEAFTKKPHNVIRGNFARPGQIDWAILCSVNRVSSILVFFNGSEKNVHEIAKMEDRIYLQGISADKIASPGASGRSGRISSCGISGHMVGRHRRPSTIRGSTMSSLRKRP